MLPRLILEPWQATFRAGIKPTKQKMESIMKFKFDLPMCFAAALLSLTCIPTRAQRTAQKTQEPNSVVAASVAPSIPTSAASAATASKADEDFVIGADDVLAINVWKEPDISRSIPVRSDGKISLPLIGELQASGQTPRQLEKEIAGKLQNYISEPEVTVIVQEIRSQRFNILGQVTKPGSYLLTNSTTVLDAIAMAGGFRDFAKQKSIYVLRQSPNGSQTRLPFNYKDVIKGKGFEQNVRLQPRDTIVIP
jgi:polysaccharide biosynthesis/export protein